MARRIEQINELLRAELSYLIARESPLENGLITITYVRTGADLKNATIGISVLPENLSGTALRQLKRISGQLARELNKKLKIQFIPKFRWEIDTLERNAFELEDAISRMK